MEWVWRSISFAIALAIVGWVGWLLLALTPVLLRLALLLMPQALSGLTILVLVHRTPLWVTLAASFVVLAVGWLAVFAIDDAVDNLMDRLTARRAR
jgi:hypothetical protein